MSIVLTFDVHDLFFCCISRYEDGDERGSSNHVALNDVVVDVKGSNSRHRQSSPGNKPKILYISNTFPKPVIANTEKRFLIFFLQRYSMVTVLAWVVWVLVKWGVATVTPRPPLGQTKCRQTHQGTVYSLGICKCLSNIEAYIRVFEVKGESIYYTFAKF